MSKDTRAILALIENELVALNCKYQQAKEGKDITYKNDSEMKQAAGGVMALETLMLSIKNMERQKNKEN